MAIGETGTNGFDAEISHVILPAQYFATIRGTGLSSEQRLMLAVLMDAINILQEWQRARSARKRRDLAETAHWVNMRESPDPFSFDNICDALDIDSEALPVRRSAVTSGHPNAAKIGHGRLRIRQWTRAQHMTPNSARRRSRAHLAVVPG